MIILSILAFCLIVLLCAGWLWLLVGPVGFEPDYLPVMNRTLLPDLSLRPY